MKDFIWNKCVEFHGHECGGLTIGYKAALYAIELLGLAPVNGEVGCCISDDEEIVCISENDACGVDAIQVILGCSIGKGNLLFHMSGKPAFSIYDRNTDKSVRLVLKPTPEGITREKSFDYYQGCSFEDMFDIKKTRIELPEKARFFNSIYCTSCGERTAENKIHLQGEEKLCIDCYQPYNRFDI